MNGTKRNPTSPTAKQNDAGSQVATPKGTAASVAAPDPRTTARATAFVDPQEILTLMDDVREQSATALREAFGIGSRAAWNIVNLAAIRLWLESDPTTLVMYAGDREFLARLGDVVQDAKAEEARQKLALFNAGEEA